MSRTAQERLFKMISFPSRHLTNENKIIFSKNYFLNFYFLLFQEFCSVYNGHD